MRLWPASPINPTLLSTRPPMNSAAMTIAFNPRARCKRDRRWVYVGSPIIRLVSHEQVAAASFAERGTLEAVPPGVPSRSDGTTVAGLEGYVHSSEAQTGLVPDS